MVSRILTPTFFFQKIYRRDGSLYGIEILTRDVVPNEYTDIYLFYKILETIVDKDLTSTAKKLGIKIHVNIYPNSIKFVNWREIPEEIKDVLVVEIIESGLKDCSILQTLIDNNIVIALDDFGEGMSNFSVITKVPFKIIKIDGQAVPDVEYVSKILKNNNNFIIVEKEVDKTDCLYVDAYQNFNLHFPQPLKFISEETLTK